VAPQDSQICGGNFQKRQKIGRRLVPNMSYGYIEIVINSTRVMGIRVTISCPYCIIFEVTISSWLNFGPPVPRKGVCGGRKYLAPPYALCLAQARNICSFALFHFK